MEPTGAAHKVKAAHKQTQTTNTLRMINPLSKFVKKQSQLFPNPLTLEVYVESRRHPYFKPGARVA
jgi:hypothetical protein